MANPWTGEVRVSLDGEERIAKLTLGALAELEAELEADTLLDLIGRLESGRFGAVDVAAVVAAGLRGGGWKGCARDVLNADLDGGALEAARVAGRLLARAFGT